MNLLTGLLKIR